jgi:cytochrome bd-type quinol oxidase subunit 2
MHWVLHDNICSRRQCWRCSKLQLPRESWSGLYPNILFRPYLFMIIEILTTENLSSQLSHVCFVLLCSTAHGSSCILSWTQPLGQTRIYSFHRMLIWFWAVCMLLLTGSLPLELLTSEMHHCDHRLCKVIISVPYVFVCLDMYRYRTGKYNPWEG